MVIHLVISVPTLFWLRWVSIQVPSQPLQTPCTRTWGAENVEWFEWNIISSIPLDMLQSWKPPQAFMVVHQSHKWKSLHFFRSPMLQWITTQEWAWYTEIYKKKSFFILKLLGFLTICFKYFSLLIVFFTFILFWWYLLQKLSKNV